MEFISTNLSLLKVQVDSADGAPWLDLCFLETGSITLRLI